MKLTQGQFSFLPDLTDEEISAQVRYALDNEWSLAVEHTDDPHPRNTYWAMWGEPMFDLKDAAGVMMEVKACREANPQRYVKVLAFDANMASRPSACRSWCSARRTSPASSWCAPKAPVG